MFHSKNPGSAILTLKYSELNEPSGFRCGYLHDTIFQYLPLNLEL